MFNLYSTEGIDLLPAPVAKARVSAQLRGKEAIMPVLMLLDTGADCCCLPRAVLEAIEGSLGRRLPYDQIKVEDFTGKISYERRHMLTLKIEGFDEALVQCIIIAGQVGIIGRSFLNLRPILFNGPELQWGLCSATRCYSEGA